MLPYRVVSICLVVVIMALSWWHFGVAFYQPHALALICLLFLLCSLGLGLLISTFSRTQTQAIQFSVFFLLPVLSCPAHSPRSSNYPRPSNTFRKFSR